MRNAQKPDHISLNTLIGRLREGRYVIPDFQREFEWEPWDITLLVRSIFLDYYIGSLLLWKGKKENFEALSCESVYGYSESGNPEHIVLDGQQRLTAMYYAFFAPDKPLPNRANRAMYFVKIDKFMEEDYDDAFYYDWLTARWSRILKNRELQYEQHIFPLSVLGTGTGFEVAVWVLGYQQYWKDKASEARDNGDTAGAELADIHVTNANSFGQHLKEITEEYQISYIELDQDLEVEKVCDIFTQVNSRGVRLDVFDLINALLRPKGIQLKAMMRNASPRLEFVNSPRVNVYILQVMSIIRQAYCSPKYLYYLMPGQVKPIRDPHGARSTAVLVPGTDDFEKLWDGAVNALEASIQVLRHPQEFGVISSKYLPYAAILPVFSALQWYTDGLPPERRLDAKRKIRHWYWASVFTKRYSGAVESTSTRDYLDIRAWIDNDAEEPTLMNEFANRLRDTDFTSETNTNSSVYSGIFNLLVVQGARDWMTGTVPQHDDLDDHHIIPASWGVKNLNGNLGHTILNRTPLTADTNRYAIGSRLPNEYLPELIEKNGEDKVQEILESHLISSIGQNILLRVPFTPDDFWEFIIERQRTIRDSIQSLLVKGRLQLPLPLRHLDEIIEQIEIRLRTSIADRLENDPTQLPPHVAQKLHERIQTAIHKNATLDEAQYRGLREQLEYADLMELQEIITNKTLWPVFTSRFANKETLNVKFSQLADLRNGIRHSRAVSEIIQKEGEASLLWFEQVLGK